MAAPNRGYIRDVEHLTGLGLVIIPLEGKKPILPRWNKLEKTPSRMHVFENRNIGVLCGLTSGITVLDIDASNGGVQLWKRLSMCYPAFTTPMVRTPGGGMHIYFKYNRKLHSLSSFKLRGARIGWDLLNNDRVAVLPPSKNIDTGKAYVWANHIDTTPLARMPPWLEEYLLACKYFE